MTTPRSLAVALLFVVLAACGTDNEPEAVPAQTVPEDVADEPADEPADEAASEATEAAVEDDVPAGVPVSGDGWSAFFPGQPEQFVEEVPLPELDIVLTNDVTAYESPTEALAVMLAQMPIDPSSPTAADDMRAQLFSTAAGMGTVIEDSPVLDADGTFRGRDAVVVTDGTGELNALMFVQGATVFQVIHVARTPDGGAALLSFVEGLTLEG
ncbi:MAG: hypothetical protein ACLFV0_00895 [Nitriliruptoraceae bacterium]